MLISILLHLVFSTCESITLERNPPAETHTNASDSETLKL